MLYTRAGRCSAAQAGLPGGVCSNPVNIIPRDVR